MKGLIKKIGVFVTVVIAFMLLDINGNHVRTEAATATTISTASQLSQIVNNPYGDYELTADIDVSGLELNKILLGDSACFDISFEGTLDGKGHKITGVKQGLFRSIGTKGVIKNLDMEVNLSEKVDCQNRYGVAFENLGTIDNVNITCTTTSFIDRCMAISSAYVYSNAGEIKNCKTKLIVKDADMQRECIISGVSCINYGTITDITAELDVSNLVSQYYVAISGICGSNYAYGKVANCTIKGSMYFAEAEGDKINYTYLTAVTGENYGIVDNCSNYCDITSGVSVSGIVDNNMGIITSCINYGTITSNYLYVGIINEQGGISARNQGVIKDCINYGKIVIDCYSDQTYMLAGGISGVAMTYAVFDNCINNGEIIITNKYNYHTAGIVGDISLDVFSWNDAGEKIYTIGTVAFNNCVNNASCPQAWLVGFYSVECDESQIIVNNCSNTYSGLSMYIFKWIEGVSEDRKNSIFLVCDDSDNKFRINNEASTVYKGKQFKLDIYNPNNSKYTVAVGRSQVKGDYITGVGYGQELVIVYTDTGAFDYILLDISGYEKVIVNNYLTIEELKVIIDNYGINYEEGMRLLVNDPEIASVDTLGNAYTNKIGTTDVYVWYAYGYAPIRFVIEVVTQEDYNYTGWKQVDDKKYYFNNGEKCVGLINISDKWYYFNNSGAMQTGWCYLEGKRYYMDNETGEMQTGWIDIEDKRYYLNEEGVMQTGWISLSSEWYYLDETGAMQIGWVKDGKWYYMNTSGIMQTGWVKDGSKWYYMNKSGAMQTGWVKDGSKWYYMDSSGAMKTGWVKSSGKWYYMNSSGAMQTGWVKDGSKWYYLAKSGAMFTGWIQSGGKWYYTNSSGAMKTGWLKLSGKWYYFDENGAMVTGSRNINGKVYYFNKDGIWME